MFLRCGKHSFDLSLSRSLYLSATMSVCGFSVSAMMIKLQTAVVPIMNIIIIRMEI